MNILEQPFYPETLFIDEYVAAEREAELLRSIVATDHFSNGHSMVRHWMAEFANLEITCAPPELEERVTQAVHHVDNLMFETEFADILALGNKFYSDPDVDPVKIEQKAETLADTWEMIKQSDRLATSYQAVRPLLESISTFSLSLSMAGLREVFKKPQVLKFSAAVLHMGNALLYLDNQRLDPAQDQVTGFVPPESLFREGICDQETKTGVPVFDRTANFMTLLARSGFLAAGLTVVNDRWNYWHPKVPFLPASWTQGRSNEHPYTSQEIRQSQSLWKQVSDNLRAGEETKS
jgi:hypothetical protein